MGKEIFALCDANGDGVLNEREMLRLAVHTGFEGTPEKWSEQFGVLCRKNNRDPSAGVDIVLMEKLLSDDSDDGSHFTADSELEILKEKIQKKALEPEPEPVTAVSKSSAIITNGSTASVGADIYGPPGTVTAKSASALAPA